ncbi:SDR family NAD(P)-dependent oxidoreductase [Daejeonella sp. H1SJ63]|jgi:NADP-dependent 3-hydroxy acid dehydrogenase YdfG|uniref:SDR family NAD(P)-dependent oxidoreductase n=1 Tax=Daejeonella sp. H1SJ63 TaxID=3034145 RepID=UPI0023EA7C02|nr:SDR family NAD(P)-dependent oxidoreductase [Daejeonella sp. H1SJ63]
MSKIALITGATAGIGEACARLLAAQKYDLILAARRAERLDALSKQLIDEFGIRVITLVMDVRKKEEVQKLETLSEDWKQVDVLINNAGLSQGLDPINSGNTDDWDVMIDTNVKGLLYVTKIVSTWMVNNAKGGHIINIGSIAGKETYQNGNVYCATKHAVDSLNKAMRIDLLPHKIKVTGIHPGAVETEFSEVRFKGDKERAKKVYEGYEPLHAQDIAETIWFAISRPAHVNINDMLVMPTAQASTSHLLRE